MAINVISYGGGVQSTSLLVLASRGVIQADAAIFVELDTENPSTIRYVHDVAKPFCETFGIEFLTVKVSLLQMIEEKPEFPLVPFRDKENRVFGKRQCTNHAKIRPFRRALRALMRARGERHANVMLGISFDELQRMRDSDTRYITNIYPLIDLFYTREKCKQVIDGVLPLPQKSSCWFCPYASSSFQRRVFAENPHLTPQAVALQELLDCARDQAGLDRLVVVRFDASQEDMFDSSCGGMCHT